MKSKHHIRPKSVGGSNAKDNIAFVTSKSHEKYHSLFDNRTPVEILDFLVSYFWKGNKQHIYEYLERKR
jgi:hypothetical protein